MNRQGPPVWLRLRSVLPKSQPKPTAQLHRSAGLLLLLAASTAATAQFNDVVNKVRQLALSGHLVAAQEVIEKARAGEENQTSKWLAAASWLARGASFFDQWDLAEKYAREVLARSSAQAATKMLVTDPNLSTSLGASIEVLGKAYDARGDRGAAIEFLRKQHEKYLDTPIETRIQKNILLLSLKGKPLPELDVSKYLLSRPATLENISGKVLLLYFWAHWCSDCKQQERVLELLHKNYSEEGLAFLGPTKLYGYATQGRVASPSEEISYLTNDYQRTSPTPPWMSVPLSAQNFRRFGVSSTPTLVLVDRKGIVRLYHPGYLGYKELKDIIEPLINSQEN